MLKKASNAEMGGAFSHIYIISEYMHIVLISELFGNKNSDKLLIIQFK